MKVLIVENAHFIRTKDGKYYTPSIYSYDFFKRYLNVFEEVKCMGKTKYVDEIDKKKYLKVSGPGIEVLELPWYQGLYDMLRVLPKLIHIYRKAGNDCDCRIYKIAQVESFLEYIFSRKKLPFCVEVVNDPKTFIDLPWCMRKFSIYMTKRMTREANGASYVTERYLQSIYPRKTSCDPANYFETFYSSIDLDDADIFEKPIHYVGGKFNIVHVANAINTDVKGHTTLIRAFALINKSAPYTRLIIIGDGTKLKEYKQLVEELRLSDKVTFTGRINDKKLLLSRLRECHLMILPTKMEGLPRTIIEAMAMGLPCLSSPTAGVPELLDDKYLFSPDDFTAFAEKTLELLSLPNELYEMSARNIEASKKYRKTILEEKRTDFYRKLRKLVDKNQKG